GLSARVHGVRYPPDARQKLAEAGMEFAGYLPNFWVPEAFAAAAATVHIPRRPYVRMLPGIPTIRVFEALACGIPLVCAPWNGAATYYRGILWALAARGHRITFYEPDAFDRQAHRDIPDPSWARVVVYPVDRTEGVLSALEEARRCDLMVKASGIGVFDALLEAQVPATKRPGALAVFWDVDAPATLDRVGADREDPFRQLIPSYDMILTYGGGPPVVAAYQRFGARDCVPIYNGLDPATHYPVAPGARFACDLGLIANRLPDRERRIEEFFLAVAA